MPPYLHQVPILGSFENMSYYSATQLPPPCPQNCVQVPILGIVENMSYYCCPNCHHVDHIFGSGGVDRAAADMDMEVLGKVRGREGGGIKRGGAVLCG